MKQLHKEYGEVRIFAGVRLMGKSISNTSQLESNLITFIIGTVLVELFANI